MNFQHLETAQGLSMNNVNDIIQDQYGFMWFGTEDGLNRFDGYEFRIYRQNEKDPRSLANSFIRALLYDSKNRLWIATRSGLCRYIPEYDNFVQFQSGTDSLHSINSDIQAIFEDSRGRIWITGEKGVDCLYPEQQIFRHYLPDPDDPNSLSSNTIYQIKENRQGMIWIATENGLNLLDPESGHCRHYYSDPGNTNSLSSNYIRSLLIDERDNLWIGTYETGLDYYDVHRKQFTHFPTQLGKKNSLSHYQVNDMAFHWDGNLWVATTEGLNFIKIDRNRPRNSRITQYLEDPNNSRSLSASHIQKIWVDSSRIWLATRFGGVNFYDKYGSKFRKYTTVSTGGNGLSHSNVTSFCQDNEGRLYIGTDGGGVNVLDPQTGKFHYLMHDADDPNTISNNKVLSVLFEPPYTLWIGMWSGGVNRYNLQSGQIRHYQHDAKNPESVSGDNIFYLFLDSQDQIWVGTWSAGLNRYDRKSDRFIRYPFNISDSTGKSNETIISIFEDQEKNIWLATEGSGLSRLNQNLKQFTHYRFDKTDSATLSSDYVIAACQDSENRFWITTTNGLNLFDPQTEKFTVFHEKDGLPAETLYGILEDDESHLWVSSIHGLSEIKVDDTGGKTNINCINYTIDDGLQGEQYSQWAYYKCKDGTMYFGGLKGFNVFHPREIRQNPVPPYVLISGFQLSLKPVSFKDPGSPLHKPVYLTDHIMLSYKESMLTFEYVGISFTQPEKNRYAYRLENFDGDEWHEVGTERKATYTNLDPKKYTFQVRAANNAGIWSDHMATLDVTITPPFWEKLPFRIFAFLFLSGLTLFLYKWRTHSIRRKNEQLEAEVSARTDEIIKRKNEVEQAYNRMNEAVGRINESIHKMTRLADTVADTASEINETSQKLAAGASEHASSISEMSSSLQELFASASANAVNSQDTNDITKQAQRVMENSTVGMQNLSAIIKRIHHATNETETVIRTMEEIATMIQMLSINAAIESMRAGEYGKGFQAVAKEVQELAEQSENAVQNTKNLIHNAIEHVEKGTQINRDVMKQFKSLSQYVNRINGLMGEISAVSVQQKLGIDQINTGVDQLNQVMKMSSEAVHHSAERSGQLHMNAEELQSLVNILTDAIRYLTLNENNNSKPVEKLSDEEEPNNPSSDNGT
jgi:methyl-accepting chemotaxis protein/ligand-binding sensor domain-containing protein